MILSPTDFEDGPLGGLDSIRKLLKTALLQSALPLKTLMPIAFEAGAMDYTVVVAATASDSAPL
jgi:hypothetical protein